MFVVDGREVKVLRDDASAHRKCRICGRTRDEYESAHLVSTTWQTPFTGGNICALNCSSRSRLMDLFCG